MSNGLRLEMSNIQTTSNVSIQSRFGDDSKLRMNLVLISGFHVEFQRETTVLESPDTESMSVQSKLEWITNRYDNIPDHELVPR